MTAAVSPKPVNSTSIYLYFGPLTLLVYMALPDGYLLDIATSYMLKNQLHATPNQVSMFRLVTALPIYFAFLFGFARDLWNPLGLRDRGFFLLFAPIGAVTLLWMAFSPMSYSMLVVGMLLLILSFRFISAAYQGLLALVGQEHRMSGRLSALYNMGSFACYVVGSIAAGWVTEHLVPRQIFIIAACLTGFIAALGVWKPRAVFNGTYEQPLARGGTPMANVQRLLRHRATYPAVLIISAYNISPSFGTPLQYYLADELHAADSLFANYFALNMLAYLPGFFAYGVLCKKFALRRLLLGGTLLAIPSGLLLPFVHSPTAVLLVAVQTGLMNGIAQAAYIDLALSSCPRGLQGTLMMMVIGLWTLAIRGGDVLGSWIYSSFPGHGILYCVLTATGTSILILPLLLLIPRAIMMGRDGQSEAPVGDRAETTSVVGGVPAP